MKTLFTLLLFALLFIVSWPLAVLVIVLWPLVWIISLPFRAVGIALDSVFALLRAILMLPARLLGFRSSSTGRA
jgi:hypothetical protein